jgi:hypothetical protein
VKTWNVRNNSNNSHKLEDQSNLFQANQWFGCTYHSSEEKLRNKKSPLQSPICDWDLSIYMRCPHSVARGFFLSMHGAVFELSWVLDMSTGWQLRISFILWTLSPDKPRRTRHSSCDLLPPTVAIIPVSPVATPTPSFAPQTDTHTHTRSVQRLQYAGLQVQSDVSREPATTAARERPARTTATRSIPMRIVLGFSWVSTLAVDAHSRVEEVVQP